MSRARLAGALALAATALLEPGDSGRLAVAPAQAIIGAPWTPMSYAGVARRTTRRMAYVGAASASAAYAAGTVAALPPGCARVYVGGVVHYDCAGTSYRPVYDGPEVVYVVD